MLKNLTKILTLIVVMITIISCREYRNNSSQNNSPNNISRQTVNPPIKTFDVPFDIYMFQADSGILLTRKNGTHINIDANTFQFKNGQRVNKKITLKIREFHTAKEILRAGIPMSLDTAQSALLQSGGMIELRAFADDNELVIRDGKTIKIELASYIDAKGYSLYHYDDNTNKWNVNDTFSVTNNVRKATGLKRIFDFMAKPFTPKNDENNILFELVTNTEKMPHLISFQNSKWKIIDRIKPTLLEKIKRITWDEIDIKPIDDTKMIYSLTFNSKRSVLNRSDSIIQEVEEIKIRATPWIMQSGDKTDSITFRKDFEKYTSNLQKMQVEKERLRSESDMVNSFVLNKMGIWNIDCMMKMDDLIPVTLSFDFEKEIDIVYNKIKLYMIFEDANSVLDILPHKWKNTRIPKNKKISIVAVLPNNNLAVVNSRVVASTIQKENFHELISTERIPADLYFKKFDFK